MILPYNSYGQMGPYQSQPQLIGLTHSYVPPMIKGISIYPNEPLKFDFIVDSGEKKLNDVSFKKESYKLIKYFLAALTVPEKELWVNLSPAEKDRIMPENLSRTNLGKEFLLQDYLLKQLTSSLMHPENELGKALWDKIYKAAYEKFGTTDIPIDLFNRIWIVPEKAVVYENKNTAYVSEAKLKVMLDSDYEAMRGGEKATSDASTNSIISDVIRQIIIPAIEHEVNEGKNFAPLRQIYNSLILAKWYKDTIKNGILHNSYIDQNKIFGIDLKQKKVREKIYKKYINTFKNGAYAFIKDDYDTYTQEIVHHKYFSGGIRGKIEIEKDRTMRVKDVTGPTKIYQINLKPNLHFTDNAMLVGEPGFIEWSEHINFLKSFISKEKEKKYFNEGMMLISTGKADEAVNIFSRMSQDQAKDKEGVSNYLLGILALMKDKNDFKNAIREFKASIEKAPNFWPSYNNLAYCYVQSFLHEQELKMNKIAANVKTRPYSLKSLTEAIRHTKKGLDIEPGSQTLRFITGEAYYLLFLFSKSETSRNFLQKSVKYFNYTLDIENPSDSLLIAYTYKNLTDANTHLGNYDKQSEYMDKSIQYFRKAVKLEVPGYKEAEKLLESLIKFKFSKAKYDSDNNGARIFNVITGGMSPDHKKIKNDKAMTTYHAQKNNDKIISQNLTAPNTIKENGGIDMNNIGIEKRWEERTIDFDSDKMYQFIDMKIDGFTPVIINVIPINSILPLLGLEKSSLKPFDKS